MFLESSSEELDEDDAMPVRPCGRGRPGRCEGRVGVDVRVGVWMVAVWGLDSGKDGKDEEGD